MMWIFHKTITFTMVHSKATELVKLTQMVQKRTFTKKKYCNYNILPPKFVHRKYNTLWFNPYPQCLSTREQYIVHRNVNIFGKLKTLHCSFCVEILGVWCTHSGDENLNDADVNIYQNIKSFCLHFAVTITVF